MTSTTVFPKRRAGVLFHPTSLPGPYGIGDLGPQADRFLDWMRDAGLALWQVLPLGPTSFGDSPYQCLSACAGQPLLISPERLVADGFLDAHELELPVHLPADRVDFGPAIEWKTALLRRTYEKFGSHSSHPMRPAFEAFIARPDVAIWLDDFAIFMACKAAHGGAPWHMWPTPIKRRDPATLKRLQHDMGDEINYQKFVQFLFFHQWARVREGCRLRGISIIGDAPIYVAHDSADTWANQRLFEFNADGDPIAVAGVPPDYFSATGQLWGNPLYRWDEMRKDDYEWWIARMRAILAMVDIVRLDHFRGFMGYWAVPYGSPTAEHGEWKRGPGAHFFEVLGQRLGVLPIIAEDLGDITTDVTSVRWQFTLPGMIVLQFAWGAAPGQDPLVPDPNSFFRPHQHDANMVVYTGTHDNDTTLGWWRNGATERERTMMQTYLATDGNIANWDLIRAAFASVSHAAIVPMQDFLDLDSDARMNLPGRAEGNWGWRVSDHNLSGHLADRIRRMTLLYERCPVVPDWAQPEAPKEPTY